MFNLDNKVAFITGGSGAIGYSIAKTLTAAGCKCIISGTNQSKLDAVSAALGCDNVVLDLSEVDLLENRLSDLNLSADILVNNAGTNKDGILIRMPLHDWKRVIDVNLTSSFLLSKYFLRGMMRKKTGRVVFISSIIALTGNAGQGNYAASKSAMFGLSKSIALEYASKGVTSNCVAPGFIESPMTDVLPDTLKEAYMAKIPAKRFGSVGDVANSVLFLCSDEASYVNGTVMSVNGGMYM